MADADKEMEKGRADGQVGMQEQRQSQDFAIRNVPCQQWAVA